MPDMEQQFRTAAFGGFQKQDVLDYIDSTSREHREKEDALRKELEELKGARAALETEKTELLSEKAALDDNLKGCAAALEKTNAELGEKSARLDTLERECAELRERLGKAEPAAVAYEAVKDRTAGIELEAHHRAQEVEDAARERVKEIKVEVNAWLEKVRRQYDQLRTDVSATSSHAAGELGRIAQAVEQISAGFDKHDEELEKLTRLIEEANGPQPPKPLPLDGN